MFDPYSLRQLILEHGVLVTVKRYTNGTYDPDTGTIGQTTTNQNVHAFFFNNDPSIVEFDTSAKGEKRVVISDKLHDGHPTPDLKAGDIISGFGSDVVVTRSSKITSGSQTMCHLAYVKS